MAPRRRPRETGQFTVPPWQIDLHLRLVTVREVAGVAKAGDDITLGGEFVVDGAAPDAALGFLPQDVFDPHGTGDGDDDVDLGGVAFFAEVLDRLDEGGTGGEHGVGDDDDASFELGAGDVVEPDLERAVSLVFAVGRDEAVVGLIEEIEQTLVEGKAGAEDSGDDGLVFEDLGGRDAELGLDFLFEKGKGFADLVSGHLSDAFQVTTEAHAVQLDLLITDLADPVAEERVLF
jgi:hypothetical protein